MLAWDQTQPTANLGRQLIEGLARIVKETITAREQQLKQLPFLQDQIQTYLKRIGVDR